MKIRFLIGLFLTGVGFAVAADDAAPIEAATPLRYRLFPRDLIRISVHGEPDASVERRVDSLGEVYVPLVGQVKLAGLTLNEAQALLAKRYIEEEIFIRPDVLVSITEYSPKEIMVLGQVGRQGKQLLPPEATSISIVEAITTAGGFTRIGRGDGVRVTRKDDRGAEQAFLVNVEKMIEGKSGAGEPFMLLPGDVVYVPERVF